MKFAIDSQDINLINQLTLPYEKLHRKTILVTGANGLIASAFIDTIMLCHVFKDVSIVALCRDKKRAVARFGSFYDDPRFSVIIQDVCNQLPEGLDCDYILHAASPAHPISFSRYPVEVMKTNFLGTLNVLNFAQSRGARVLYISSGEIYGTNTDDLEAMNEDYCGMIDTMCFRSCYPEGKRAAETLCASHRHQFGTDVVVVRPCYIYGASITDDNSRADAQFLRNALDKKDIIMKSNGSQLRTYCYVVDCVSALLSIILCGSSGEVYNVANKNSILTIRQYAETLASLVGVSLKFEIPNKTESAGYSTNSKLVLSASKLENLGWSPNFDIFRGLRKTLQILTGVLF